MQPTASISFIVAQEQLFSYISYILSIGGSIDTGI